jgi:hypothetical protein
MLLLRTIRSSLFCLLVLTVVFSALVQLAAAETKVIISEAMYTMGDGETPAYAETRAIQKAKVMALEQAGTYVESYSRTNNMALTTEEIQTLAGGIMRTEILEKKRTQVGNSLQFWVKIRATVMTDNVEDLVRRLRKQEVLPNAHDDGDEYYGEGYAKKDQEQAYRKALRQEYPDMSEKDFELNVQYGLGKQRERVIKKKALRIEIREKYPHLSEQEREVLVEAALARDRDRASEVERLGQ